MALILALESSTMTCSVALLRNNSCWLLEEYKNTGDHARELTNFIDKITTLAQTPLNAIDAIAVSSGPGSYTGLRIGVSVAKGLCYSLDKPLIAVCSLKAMAYGAMERDAIKPNDIIVALQDARRMDAYAAVYDSKLNELAAAHFATLEIDSFKKWCPPNGRIWYCGTGAAKMPLVNNSLHSKVDGPSAAHLEQLAFQKWKNTDFENFAYFEPFYLKPPNITKPKNKFFK